MRFAGANIAGFMSERPNFGELGSLGMEARSSERQTNSAAEGYVAQAGLDSMAKIKEAKYQAEGIEAQGAANAAATQAQGMSSMMSGIAGGIGSMSFGGGGLPAVGTQARATADMNTLSNYTQADMNALWKGSFGG